MLTAAAILVSVYIAGVKGAMKAFSTFIAYLVAFVMALSISASVSDSLSGKTIKSSNSKKISKTLESYKFVDKLAERISGLEYNIRVDGSQLDKIFNSGKDFDTEIYTLMNHRQGRNIGDTQEVFAEKLHGCYSGLIRDIVAEELSEYAAEVAAKEVLKDPALFNNLIPLLIDKEDRTPAADFIAEHYTKPAYRTVTWLILALILFAILMVVMLLVINYVIGNGYHEQGIPSHVGGALIGIPKGIILAFAIAVGVRLLVVLGSDEMLFFNFKAVDKTYIFKYLYNYVEKHM